LAEAVLGRAEPPVGAAGEAGRRLARLLEGAEPALARTVIARLVAVWRRLRSAAEGAPERIEAAPPLPPGTGLPQGVDPDEIEDPELRRRAEEAEAVHRRAAERWNEGQAALGWIRELAALLPPDARQAIEERAR
jgi:hypothetical protein